MTLTAGTPATTRAAVLPALAAGTAVTLTASVFVVMRHINQDLSPGAVSLGRLMSGTAVAAPSASPASSSPAGAQPPPCVRRSREPFRELFGR